MNPNFLGAIKSSTVFTDEVKTEVQWRVSIAQSSHCQGLGIYFIPKRVQAVLKNKGGRTKY